MSLLGKIFVVFNTFLAVLFLGMSATLYNFREDWRTAYELLKARHKEDVKRYTDEVAKRDSQVKSADDQVKLYGTTTDKWKTEVDNLSSRYKDTEKKYADQNTQFNNLQKEKEQLHTLNDELNRTIQSLRDQLDQKTKAFEVALKEKETAEAQVARLTRLKNEYEKDLGDARADLTKTKKGLEDTQLVLNILRNKGVPVDRLAYGQPLPPKDAVVVAVDTSYSPALVLLSIGEQDGVEKGWEFTVYRGNEFVGRVVVEKVMKDLSGCRVMFTKDGATVSKGDNASTRID